MRVASLVALGAMVFATPVCAQTVVDPENMKAEDVALSPLSDVNLRKKDVPPVLEAALANPYDMTGLKSCAGFATAIESLDAAFETVIENASSSGDNAACTRWISASQDGAKPSCRRRSAIVRSSSMSSSPWRQITTASRMAGYQPHQR